MKSTFDTSSDFPFSNSNYTFPRPLITVEMPLPIYEEPSSSIISAPNSSFRRKIWCEDPIHQLSEMLAKRAIVVTNTTFFWSSWLFPFALLLWATQNSSDLSSCRTKTLCFSGPSALTLCLFFFWNIFFCAALVFSDCCSNLFSASA